MYQHVQGSAARKANTSRKPKTTTEPRSRAKEVPAPKADAIRRPGHTRRPFVAEDAASAGDEEQDGDDDDLGHQPPAPKRQRTAPAADLPKAPGDDLNSLPTWASYHYGSVCGMVETTLLCGGPVVLSLIKTYSTMCMHFYCWNANFRLQATPAGASSGTAQTAAGVGATSAAASDAPAWMWQRGTGLVDYSGDSSTELGDDRRCTLTPCSVLTSTRRQYTRAASHTA